MHTKNVMELDPEDILGTGLTQKVASSEQETSRRLVSL